MTHIQVGSIAISQRQRFKLLMGSRLLGSERINPHAKNIGIGIHSGRLSKKQVLLYFGQSVEKICLEEGAKFNQSCLHLVPLLNNSLFVRLILSFHVAGVRQK